MKNKILFLFFMLALTLTACGASDSVGARHAVESYISALAAKDEAGLLSNSCADYEDDALLVLDSLELVEVTLADGWSVKKLAMMAIQLWSTAMANYK
ncbi:MAG: hypothetical protein UZ14_CFX002002690 [Chloroflexi bacterium OLB14]|nr:MAG: hypothetical protein UZ14_CFX002002690 [Chloroflexi bacterium OLB14]